MKKIKTQKMEKQKLTKKDLEQIIAGWCSAEPPRPSDDTIILLSRK